MSLKTDVSSIILSLFALARSQRSKRQLPNSKVFNFLVINSVENTKFRPCYTLPPTQHHSFFRKNPFISSYFYSLNVKSLEPIETLLQGTGFEMGTERACRLLHSILFFALNPLFPTNDKPQIFLIISSLNQTSRTREKRKWSLSWQCWTFYFNDYISHCRYKRKLAYYTSDWLSSVDCAYSEILAPGYKLIQRKEKTKRKQTIVAWGAWSEDRHRPIS